MVFYMQKIIQVEGMNLKDIVSKWEKKYKKFISDVAHRWNLTCAMLEYVYDNKDVLTMYCNEYFPEVGLSTSDWEISYMIKEFLETFNIPTKFFSGVYYPTTFMTIKQLYYISDIFQNIDMILILRPLLLLWN